jgi:hypothetical protein
MNNAKVISFVMFGLSIAGCATVGEDQQESEDTGAVLELAAQAPASCLPLTAIARPILAPHYHAPELTQTAGKLTMRVGGSGVRTGTSLATIVGVNAEGVPLGNHDWLFADAGFRTRNDLLTITPTADPCVFDVSSEIYIVEGTGAYAGLTGTVNGTGFVSFCGAEGRIDISGYVCP